MKEEKADEKEETEDSWHFHGRGASWKALSTHAAAFGGCEMWIPHQQSSIFRVNVATCCNLQLVQQIIARLGVFQAVPKFRRPKRRKRKRGRNRAKSLPLRCRRMSRLTLSPSGV